MTKVTESELKVSVAQEADLSRLWVSVCSDLLFQPSQVNRELLNTQNQVFSVPLHSNFNTKYLFCVETLS